MYILGKSMDQYCGRSVGSSSFFLRLLSALNMEVISALNRVVPSSRTSDAAVVALEYAQVGKQELHGYSERTFSIPSCTSGFFHSLADSP